MTQDSAEIKAAKDSLGLLEKYCRLEEYKGWDPYDGLNSKVFRNFPLLKRSDLARLAWIQLFKRNPINLRRLFLVPREYNPKGIALYLSAYCNLLRYHRLTGDTGFGDEAELLNRINFLSEVLISLRSSLKSENPQLNTLNYSSWGYNFPWQARRLFLFPEYTPTVVATSFGASALFDAHEVTGNEKYRQIAHSSSGFVMNELHRTQVPNGFLFSYSPLEGNNTVINASLLGTRLLAQCYKNNNDSRLLEAARTSASACAAAQNSDGSWYYGLLPVQRWIDSFHTGYNLEALNTYMELTGDSSFTDVFEKGLDFYLKNFFVPDGTPKYYHNKIYPVDIHCPGQLLVTLCRTGRLSGNRELAEKVLAWTISNMQHQSGYFYYQKHKYYTNRISYSRWSNAFMFNAMALFLISSS